MKGEKRNKIHIGYHKTGTTFLQKHIFPNVKNYQGRVYSSVDENNHSFEEFQCRRPVGTCKKIIQNFQSRQGIFISDESFTKIRQEDLFQILNNEWDVLVVARNLTDIVRSRKSHYCQDFFLYDKISRTDPSGEIDQEIRDFYNPENLSVGIANLTILSFEKLFSGDEEEVARLSAFLEHDISKIFEENRHKKANKTPQWREKLRNKPRRKL